MIENKNGELVLADYPPGLSFDVLCEYDCEAIVEFPDDLKRLLAEMDSMARWNRHPGEPSMQNLDSNPTIFLTEHQIEIILFCAYQNPNKSKYGQIKILVSLFSTKKNVARPLKT